MISRRLIRWVVVLLSGWTAAQLRANSPPAPVTVILARHGTSDYDPSAPQTNPPDPPLAETGHKEAEALAARARQLGVGRVYCSPLRRARQTANIVATAIGVKPVVVPELTEFNVGDLLGRDWSKSPYKEQLADLFADPGKRRPGGETFAELEQRAVAAFRRIVAAHPGETILIVAHGVINRALYGHAQGMTTAEAYALPSQPHTRAWLIHWTGSIPAKVASLDYKPTNDHWVSLPAWSGAGLASAATQIDHETVSPQH